MRRRKPEQAESQVTVSPERVAALRTTVDQLLESKELMERLLAISTILIFLGSQPPRLGTSMEDELLQAKTTDSTLSRDPLPICAADTVTCIDQSGVAFTCTTAQLAEHSDEPFLKKSYIYSVPTLAFCLTLKKISQASAQKRYFTQAKQLTKQIDLKDALTEIATRHVRPQTATEEYQRPNSLPALFLFGITCIFVFTAIHLKDAVIGAFDNVKAQYGPLNQFDPLTNLQHLLADETYGDKIEEKFLFLLTIAALTLGGTAFYFATRRCEKRRIEHLQADLSKSEMVNYRLLRQVSKLTPIETAARPL